QVQQLASEVKHEGVNVAQWLRRPENSWSRLPESICNQADAGVWELLENDLRYAGYVRRQEELVGRSKKLARKAIPPTLDYGAVRGLRTEARLKLAAIAPADLGQASRISGVTPADVALLAVWLERR
ncbi:MAG: tRNA uridine-5-carboxymethylaminomethyl(34) synthesis enzyme MnmG, partial [Verrucomicrobia bacterium]|nr:tRNA uridine-5-carboxymethylaminomethyl(34) synthesis enzyme MnmG [Verrucomicrobiota bacterium]